MLITRNSDNLAHGLVAQILAGPEASYAPERAVQSSSTSIMIAECKPIVRGIGDTQR